MLFMGATYEEWPDDSPNMILDWEDPRTARYARSWRPEFSSGAGLVPRVRPRPPPGAPGVATSSTGSV
eukprot:SAG31_NODE_5380_length_2575_cov_1.254039_2_plen_68_part_00